ncbi:hypothetical protein GS397_15010 [Sphingobium yanoikuyae]|uniref:Uncharacterized protein n=1 Tax=Sphingobium yanoikuyae TaxID=13690 RepID=A0A6P1GIZ9_SPHYA|nr:hypothetical protein [Sphingobium yanoikuyae]QHD68224.1 hypothetical protein GS397_15010 [Sphingobium yanoikuyae]
MANLQKGEASFIAANGQTYVLVLDFNAFAEAEDAADMDIDALLKAVAPVIDEMTGLVTRMPRVKHLGALLQGALAANHPGLTKREVRNLLHEEGCGEALGKALSGAMPKPKIASAEGKAQPAPGTGTKRKRTGRPKG